MRNIFQWDSPFMQKLAMAGNLIVLNMLWILCSLPIVTMGAATAGMYYTVFQYLTNEEDAVFKPFFRGFAKNFKQATIVWVVLLATAALMVFNVRYLFAFGANNLVGVVIIVVSALLLLVQPQILPQIARFETDTKTVLQNAALLTMLHMPSSLLMAVLNVLPVAVFFLFSKDFMQWLPLWVGIWFSLVAYLNGRMLLKIWSKHMDTEAENKEMGLE